MSMMVRESNSVKMKILANLGKKLIAKKTLFIEKDKRETEYCLTKSRRRISNSLCNWETT
jgi:hypothetical protein